MIESSPENLLGHHSERAVGQDPNRALFGQGFESGTDRRRHDAYSSDQGFQRQRPETGFVDEDHEAVVEASFLERLQTR